MIPRFVLAAILGAIVSLIIVNPVATALIGRVAYPAATAFVVVHAAIGLTVGLVGMLATPSAAAGKSWRRGA